MHRLPYVSRWEEGGKFKQKTFLLHGPVQHSKTKKEGQLEMNLQRGTTSRLGRSSLAGGLQKPKHSEVLSLCNYTEVA